MNNITKERREAYVEVLEILENMDAYYKEKIPLNVRKHLKENASTEYKFYINLSKPLEEQNLNDITKNILATFNLEYWCETEEEKQKWESIYSRNKEKYEQELNKKYNLDNIFTKRKEQILKKRIEDKKLEEKRIQEEIAMLEAARLEIVEYEETLLEKIINKLKSFFRNIK